MYLSIAFTLLGFILVFLEFFLPGGLIAIVGGLLLVAGMCAFSLQEVSLLYKILYFLGTAGLTALACQSALWIIKNRNKEEFYLASDQEGFIASKIEEKLVGLKGVALSDLKPSGHISIDGQRFQAVSEGTYIKKGSPIFILERGASHYIVKELS